MLETPDFKVPVRVSVGVQHQPSTHTARERAVFHFPCHCQSVKNIATLSERFVHHLGVCQDYVVIANGVRIYLHHVYNLIINNLFYKAHSLRAMEFYSRMLETVTSHMGQQSSQCPKE